jgi:integrase
MTWDEVERIVKRGGLTRTEEKDLWDSVFLSKRQVGEVLNVVKTTATHPFLYAMFVLAGHTGARRSELMRSRVDDLDFDRKLVRIREKKKDRSCELTYREVPMSNLVEQVMSEWLQNHPGGVCTFCRRVNVQLKQTFTSRWFRRSLEGTKWVRLRGFHVFRHSFASNLAAEGVDQRTIDAFMGHQTEAMRRRYRHLFPDQRREAIDRVFS